MVSPTRTGWACASACWPLGVALLAVCADVLNGGDSLFASVGLGFLPVANVFVSKVM